MTHAASRCRSYRGIPHATVHRLLQDLLAARLVVQQPDGRGYVLGRLAFEYGLAVCYAHTATRRPDTPLTVTVGGRRPLGVGAARLALLAAQDDTLVEQALADHAEVLGHYGGLSAARLRELLEQTRTLGYARSGGCLNTNTAAVGHTACDAAGQAFAAVSLSTTQARLTHRETARLDSLLRAEIADIKPRCHFQWSDSAALR